MKTGKIIVALRSTSSKYDCDFSKMEYKMFALKKRSFEGGFALSRPTWIVQSQKCVICIVFIKKSGDTLEGFLHFFPIYT